MKGTISQWLDVKGFGFIQPDDDSEKIFFHISSVKTNARRPQIGDSVSYETTYDSQQKRKAKKVVIEGVAKNTHQTEIFTKNIINYISILVISISFIVLGFEFYHTNTIQSSWPCMVLIVIAFFILNCPKIPKNTSFK